MGSWFANLRSGMPPSARSKLGHFTLIAVGIVLAFLLRWTVVDVETGDYTWSLSGWYDHLRAHGFRGFKDHFSDYSPPYLYLLWMATWLPIKKIAAIKLISVVFDFVLATVVSRMVAVVHPRHGLAQAAAFFAVLFAPSVVLNGSVWGQCDAIYASFAVASVWLVSKGRRVWPILLLGIALSFKQQAIFLLPALTIYAMKRQVSRVALALLPLPFFLLAIPTVCAGRPLKELLLVYVEQAGHSDELSRGAVNFYHWIPQAPPALFANFGVVLTLSMLFFLASACLLSRATFTPRLSLLIGLESVMLSVFLLPRMHERYFFVADVLSIVYAFYRPQRFWIAILVVSASALSYLNFALGMYPVPVPYLAFLMLTALVAVSRDVVTDLFPAPPPGDGFCNLTSTPEAPTASALGSAGESARL